MTRRILTILAVVVGAGLAPPSWALADQHGTQAQMPQPTAEAQLWQALRLDEMMPILQDEALAQADEMAQALFERGSDAGWRERVGAIHDPQRLTGLLRAGLQRELEAQPAELIDAAIAFYESPLGGQIARLELEGRIAMLDGDTESAAYDAFAEAQAIEAPRAEQILTLIDRIDLIEQNVASGLNAALAFSQGFADGGGYQVPMSEAEILSDTWAQEGQIRLQTEEWITAYLYMSYAPLSRDEVDRFIAFAESAPGFALWNALSLAFDAVYLQTSYEMGQAAALHVSGRQL